MNWRILIAVGAAAGGLQAETISFELLGSLPEQRETVLCSQIDLDDDGLIDTVSVRLEHSKTATWPVSLTDGQPFRLEVKSVDFTLATGERGTGQLEKFTAIRLTQEADICINRTGRNQIAKEHAVQISDRELILEPISGASTPVAVCGIRFDVSVDPGLTESAALPFIPMDLARYFLPLSLLFFRRTKKQTDELYVRQTYFEKGTIQSA